MLRLRVCAALQRCIMGCIHKSAILRKPIKNFVNLLDTVVNNAERHVHWKTFKVTTVLAIIVLVPLLLIAVRVGQSAAEHHRGCRVSTVRTPEAVMTQEDYVFGLDASARQYCEEILNETDSSRAEALAILKKWIQDNPHLHVKPHDRALVPFLRGCKFDVERTKKKLEDYYTMRRDLPEWYFRRDPGLPQIQELVRLGVFVPLKRRHENQLVVIIRTAAHNPKLHKQDDVFKAGNMVLDVATKDDELTQIYGITAIFDMAGVGLAHARQMTPGTVKKAVRSWQNYHCRPKRLEFINAPVYINVVLSIFKGFMSDKLKSRVRVHYSGVEAAHKVVPKEILPKEYGGEDESLDEIIKYWQVKLLENSEWFEDDEKFKAE